MSEEKIPPLTNEPIAEGTDVDAALKKAQDERRMNNWYGVEPGQVVTDEQMKAMQDYQSAMEERELAPDIPEYAVEIKPLDETQEKQANQSIELETLTDMFKESYDTEHQATAWKLFDEFIDKYEMSREQERALRGHIIDVSKNTSVNSQTKPDNEFSVNINTFENRENTHTEDGQVESVEEVSDDLDAETERIFQEIKDKRAAEAAEDEIKTVANEVLDFDSSEEAKEQSNSIYDWESEARKEKEVLDNSEESLDEEEKERRNLWERAKDGYYRLAGRIDVYFNGGEPEQNKKRKIIAGGIAVLAVGGCIAFGVAAIHDAKEAATTAQVGGFAVPHFNPEILGSSINQVANGTPDLAANATSILQEHLGSSGDTIWYHAREALQQWGIDPTNANIQRLTENVLKDNNLSWNAAKYLQNGYEFVINKPDWIIR